MFSGGIGRKHWLEMGCRLNSVLKATFLKSNHIKSFVHAHFVIKVMMRDAMIDYFQ